MTETKFTPGPWVAVDEGRGRDRNWCVMVPEESRFGPYIATIHNTADHAKANAHLIAAAPELYEALEAVLDLRENTSPFGGELQADRIDRTIEAASAALAKARGES